MPKRTTVMLIVDTDDQGNRTIQPRVTISYADQYDSEEAKEESTAADINYLFDQIDEGKVTRKLLV